MGKLGLFMSDINRNIPTREGKLEWTRCVDNTDDDDIVTDAGDGGVWIILMMMILSPLKVIIMWRLHS